MKIDREQAQKLLLDANQSSKPDWSRALYTKTKEVPDLILLTAESVWHLDKLKAEGYVEVEFDPCQKSTIYQQSLTPRDLVQAIVERDQEISHLKELLYGSCKWNTSFVIPAPSPKPPRSIVSPQPDLPVLRLDLD